MGYAPVSHCREEFQPGYSLDRMAIAMLHVTGIPAFQDNYIWLLQRPGEARVSVVDPGDAAPVLAHLQAHQLQLDSILLTHHHRDHIGGVAALKAATGATVYGPSIERIAECDIALHDGETLQLPVLQLALQVLAVPGHVREHLAFFGEGRLFCGDTLFLAGCGRVFTGTVEQLWHSLKRLSQLPPDTLVYCTHEYTLSNLRFARTVEPEHQGLRERERAAQAMRAETQPTVPGRLATELATNPFLRCHEPALQVLVSYGTGVPVRDELACFSALRAWKNRFS
jgi:hydroxyacylglutathione hydrolase